MRSVTGFCVLFVAVLVVSPSARAITVSGFGPFGEAGSRHGRELGVGDGGEVFELDFFLKLPGGDSLQLSDGNLPAEIEFAFAYEVAGGSTDLLLRYSFTNRTGAPIDDVVALSFLDVEIDEATNSFSNEYAEVAGSLGSGAADGDPDHFEVDEAGFVFGDIFEHLFTAELDDTNAVAAGTPECVSMALAFELGRFEPLERIDVEILISSDGDTLGSFSITQRDSDPDSPTAITYSGRVARTIDAPAGSLRRGDADGDAALDADDAARILENLFHGGLAAVDCFGVPSADAGDANDNEWITIADYLAARAAATSGFALPPPAAICGEDPDDDQRGFDVVDAAFSVELGPIEIDPPRGPTDRDVFVPVLVDTPRALTGLTLILEFDAVNLTPFDPSQGDFPLFDSTLGRTLARVVDGSVAGGAIVLALWAESDGGVLVPGDAGNPQEIGRVGFHLEDFAIVRPFGWAEDVESAGQVLRATLVDESFADHHPASSADEFAFVRGNSNTDGRVDISDSVFTLNWLFLGGPDPLCMDALDANNSSLIDITDPIFTLNFLFLGGPTIPPPFPECGFDRGPPDLLGCTPCACPPYPAGDPCAGG